MTSAGSHSPSKPPVAIIGAGQLGTALARALAAQAYPIEAIISRTPSSAKRVAEAVQAPVAAGRVEAVPDAVRLIICCVPDDAIPDLAEALAAHAHPWSSTVVAHTSGALTAEVLEPLAAQGAATMSFHPVQTFAGDAGPDAFKGICIGLEGTPAAVQTGEQVARDLGARPVVISAEAKARYHLAASVASNFFVTLMGLATEVLTSIGLDRPESTALLRPLVAGTWRNLQHHLPEEALTGPIARGDAATVEQHLQALATHLPHLVPVYTALANETVRVAVRGARLDPLVAQHLLEVLHAAVEPPPDSVV